MLPNIIYLKVMLARQMTRNLRSFLYLLFFVITAIIFNVLLGGILPSNIDIIIFFIAISSSLVIVINLRWKENLSVQISQIKKEVRQSKYAAELAKLDINFPLSWTDFSISPDVACKLVEEVLLNKPLSVVECGSGDSTILIGTCLKMNGKGKIISLEHDKGWADRTAKLIKALDLEAFCEVIYSPLKFLLLDGDDWYWYSKYEDVFNDEGIDLLFVDGPPPQKNNTSTHRYPAVPIFISKLNSGAKVFLDDAKRPAEQAYFKLWSKKYNLSGNIDMSFDRGLGIGEINKIS